MIAYPLGNALYLNLTNRCTNDCRFCIRRNDDGVGGFNLWLKREPSVDEVLHAVGDPSGFNEIVFCGYGEPTYRLDTLTAVARALRPFRIPLRVNTNGHAELIAGRDVWPDLKGLVDTFSVSLNAPTAPEYVQLCRPRAGAAAFHATIEFIRKARLFVPNVVASTVDYSGVNVEGCRRLAESLGVTFRVRAYEGSSGEQSPEASHRPAAGHDVG